MITAEMVAESEPGAVLQTGLCIVDGDVWQYVAVRGGAADWAVYYGEPWKAPSEIRNNGTKLFPRDRCFPDIATQQALDLYRY
jgi:hypothetical protein